MTATQLDLLSMVRSTDPATSRISARLTDRARGMNRVLAALAHCTEPVTDHTIAELAGMPLGSAAKRRLDCERKGFVTKVDSNGITPNNRPAQRWRVTEAGLAAIKGRAA